MNIIYDDLFTNKCTYTLVTNVATNSYVTTTASARLFWYVVAKN